MDKDKKGVQPQPKKPYITPRLTIYGTIEELTKAGGSGGHDLVFGTPIDPDPPSRNPRPIDPLGRHL